MEMNETISAVNNVTENIKGSVSEIKNTVTEVANVSKEISCGVESVKDTLIAGNPVAYGFQQVCDVLKNENFLAVTDNVKEVALEVTKTVGKISSDAKTVACQISSDKRSVAEKEIDAYKTCYTQKLSTQLEILKSRNTLRDSLDSKRIQHEEFMIKQQCQMLEKMLAAAIHQFDTKVDFLRSQQQNLDEFYKKDISLITEHIQVLEDERSKNMDNTNVYMRLSDDISKLEDSKLAMKREYRMATNKLTDAIQTLEIQMKYNNPGQNINFLENRF